MKTCNGCERLVQSVEVCWKGTNYLADMCQYEKPTSIFLTGRKVIGLHNKPNQIPNWCPKEAKP